MKGENNLNEEVTLIADSIKQSVWWSVNNKHYPKQINKRVKFNLQLQVTKNSY